MITDQQYKDLLNRVNALEKQVEALSRRLNESTFRRGPSSRQVEEETPVRDTTKYNFNGISYNKRQLVLAVIKYYVESERINNSEDLNKAFPDKVQGSLGVVKKFEMAERYTNARNRYYFEDDNVLTLDDGYFVICKEWSAKNIKKFIDRAEKLGYSITPADY